MELNDRKIISALIEKYGVNKFNSVVENLTKHQKHGLSDNEFAEIEDILCKFGYQIKRNKNDQAYIIITPKFKYIIGFSNNQYWIRYQTGPYQGIIHYNKMTHEYGFGTFSDALNYFITLFNKKFNS